MIAAAVLAVIAVLFAASVSDQSTVTQTGEFSVVVGHQYVVNYALPYESPPQLEIYGGESDIEITDQKGTGFIAHTISAIRLGGPVQIEIKWKATGRLLRSER